MIDYKLEFERAITIEQLERDPELRERIARMDIMNPRNKVQQTYKTNSDVPEQEAQLTH